MVDRHFAGHPIWLLANLLCQLTMFCRSPPSRSQCANIIWRPLLNALKSQGGCRWLMAWYNWLTAWSSGSGLHMVRSYGSRIVQRIANSVWRKCLFWSILSTFVATMDVRLTGQYEDMHPGVFSAFLRSKTMAAFQIWCDFQVEKLSSIWCASWGWPHKAPLFSNFGLECLANIGQSSARTR